MKTVQVIYDRLKTNLVNVIVGASKREELKDKAIENLILYCEVGEHAGCKGLYFNSSVLRDSTQEVLEDKCAYDSSEAFEDTIQVFETIFDLSMVDEVNSLLGKEFNIDLDDDPYDTELIIYVLAKVCAELEKTPNSNGLDKVVLGEKWKVLIDENGDFDFGLRKHTHQHYNKPIDKFIELMTQ